MLIYQAKNLFSFSKVFFTWKETIAQSDVLLKKVWDFSTRLTDCSNVDNKVVFGYAVPPGV